MGRLSALKTRTAKPQPSLVRFARIDESNGSLVAITGNVDLNFSISRIFFLLDVPVNDIRGQHAHKLCNQVLFALSGSVEVSVTDGDQTWTYLLNERSTGLWIPPLLWATQKYIESKSILAVLTDRPYEENDYIRDFAEFQNYIKR